ncbi:MAG: (2Fe-2S)-binding protein [Clostridium sp.]
METIVNAVKDGAGTLEKVEEVTSVGSSCARYKSLIESIIELKR